MQRLLGIVFTLSGFFVFTGACATAEELEPTGPTTTSSDVSSGTTGSSGSTGTGGAGPGTSTGSPTGGGSTASTTSSSTTAAGVGGSGGSSGQGGSASTTGGGGTAGGSTETAGNGGAGGSASGNGGSGGSATGCNGVQPWMSGHSYAMGDTATNVCTDDVAQNSCTPGKTYVWSCIFNTCSANAPGLSASWAVWKVGAPCN